MPTLDRHTMDLETSSTLGRGSNKKRRAVFALIICALASITLTSCDQYLYEGPISLRLMDGHLSLAVCATVDVDQITSGVGPTSDSSAQGIIWKASGLAHIDRGTVLEFGAPIEGLIGSLDAPAEIHSKSVLTVVISGAESNGKSVPDIWGDFNGAKILALKHGDWLQSDGSVSKSPCPKA
jgi:hypothetical protein